MTKQEFLKRIETAWEMGLCKPEILKHADQMIDALHRLEGGQIHYFMNFMIEENERTRNFASNMQLSADELGYNCIQLMAILTHPCQQCAEDPNSWHTRRAFCQHK